MEQVRPDTSFHRGGGSAPRSHRSCKRCSDLSSQTQINKSRRYAVRGYGIRSSSFAGRIPMGISKNCFAWAGVAAMITSLHVFAADTSAPSSELETITVTAQKRSETEQTVPLSMTTFSAAALQQKEINTFFDYATKVPNLAFAPTGDGVGTARTVSNRGISTVNNVAENNTYGGAAALTVKITDTLTITPRIMQQRANYNGLPLADYLATPGNGFGYPVAGTPSFTLPRPLSPSSFTQARTFNIPEGGYHARALYSIALNRKTRYGETPPPP